MQTFPKQTSCPGIVSLPSMENVGNSARFDFFLTNKL